MWNPLEERSLSESIEIAERQKQSLFVNVLAIHNTFCYAHIRKRQHCRLSTQRQGAFSPFPEISQFSWMIAE